MNHGSEVHFSTATGLSFPSSAFRVSLSLFSCKPLRRTISLPLFERKGRCKMKRVTCVSLCIAIMLAGCAGTDPYPIAVYLPGDENKSCAALRAEIANTNKHIVRLEAQKSKQERENIFWFCAGWFLIVPWFFMDLKENEKPEIEARLQRKDALLIIAADKGCSMQHFNVEPE